jgi:hypothetical protein
MSSAAVAQTISHRADDYEGRRIVGHVVFRSLLWWGGPANMATGLYVCFFDDYLLKTFGVLAFCYGLAMSLAIGALKKLKKYRRLYRYELQRRAHADQVVSDLTRQIIHEIDALPFNLNEDERDSEAGEVGEMTPQMLYCYRKGLEHAKGMLTAVRDNFDQDPENSIHTSRRHLRLVTAMGEEDG